MKSQHDLRKILCEMESSGELLKEFRNSIAKGILKEMLNEFPKKKSKVIAKIIFKRFTEMVKKWTEMSKRFDDNIFKAIVKQSSKKVVGAVSKVFIDRIIKIFVEKYYEEIPPFIPKKFKKPFRNEILS